MTKCGKRWKLGSAVTVGIVVIIINASVERVAAVSSRTEVRGLIMFNHKKIISSNVHSFPFEMFLLQSEVVNWKEDF